MTISEMKYTVEKNEVIATEKGIYKGTLKCLSESDAEGAAEELRQSEDTPENDSDIAARWNGDWVS